MRSPSALYLGILAPFALAQSPFASGNKGTTTGGSGAYLADHGTDSTLPLHTIYLPKTIPADLKLGVLIWGEGGCMADGTSFLSILTEFSSHGFMVVASGAPEGNGSSTVQMMRDSIDWVAKNAGKGKYANVDGTRIAVAGQSCGGLEAYEMRNDTRVSTLGIFNSGEFSGNIASTIKVPIFYFLGGSTDIAYANGEKDYKQLPDGLPAWKGNIPVGHIGTYAQANGGKFGTAGVKWLEWTLRGNLSSAAYFTGSGAKDDGYTVESKNLDKLKVTPI